MNELFKFDDHDSIDTSTNIDALTHSIQKINQLPIKEEEKAIFVEQEIKLFNQKRQNQIDIFNVKENGISLLSKSINTVLNIKFDTILPETISKYYNAILTLCKFLKYKVQAFSKNNSVIYYNGQTYTEKLHCAVDFEWCEKTMRDTIQDEVIAIEKKTKNNIKYTTVDLMHVVTIALQGLLTNILTSDLLTYAFFGIYVEDNKHLITTKKEGKNDE